MVKIRSLQILTILLARHMLFIDKIVNKMSDQIYMKIAYSSFIMIKILNNILENK